MTAPPRTLVVWCPDWPITAAGVEPATPAAIVHANRVRTCSAAARKEGVRRGLRRREAQARCPGLLVLEQDLSRDARVFEPVVAAVECMTPGVEILRPGACALETRGPSRYFGGDHSLAARVGAVVDEAIAQSHLPVMSGVADGVFAATLAAKAGVVVPRSESAGFLAPHPISALPDDMTDLVDLLRRLGVTTLGRLAELPRSQVAARFGPSGERAHRLASAGDERPVAARTPPLDLTVTAELDPPAERVDIAAFAAKSIADDLHSRLSARGLACTRIRVEAETEHGESLARVWRHDGAMTPQAMADRVRWQLDGWLNGSAAQRPSAGITLLRLVPEEVGPDDGSQRGFWGSDAAADERASRAFAHVQAMLGPEAVCTAVLAGGRSPAEVVRLVPWGDPREEIATLEPWPGAVPPPAPATVHRRPLPAEVAGEGGRPVIVSGRATLTTAPRAVSLGGGRWTDVVAWAGPWPVDERWWDRRAHRRRARFQMILDDGTAHLVSVEGGRWVVEASYD